MAQAPQNNDDRFSIREDPYLSRCRQDCTGLHGTASPLRLQGGLCGHECLHQRPTRRCSLDYLPHGRPPRRARSMAAVEELLFEARHGPFAIHSSAAVYHSLGTPRNAATLPYSELRLDNNVLDGPLESPPTRISVESSFQTSRRGSETLGIVLKEARGTRPILTRTFSTATVAAPEMSATDGSDSQSDKKKNKLGYTRNSMACSK